MVADGITALIGNAIWSQGGRTPQLPDTALFNGIKLPFVDGARARAVPRPDLQAPDLGPDLITYFGFACVPLTYWALYRTRFGLRLRAVATTRQRAADDDRAVAQAAHRKAGVSSGGGFSPTARNLRPKRVAIERPIGQWHAGEAEIGDEIVARDQVLVDRAEERHGRERVNERQFDSVEQRRIRQLRRAAALRPDGVADQRGDAVGDHVDRGAETIWLAR